MFIESSVEDCWINTDQVVSFEIVKMTESDPDKPGEPFEGWFLVAHMRDNRKVKMECATEPEVIDELMRSYRDQIKEYEQRR